MTETNTPRAKAWILFKDGDVTTHNCTHAAYNIDDEKPEKGKEHYVSFESLPNTNYSIYAEKLKND